MAKHITNNQREGLAVSDSVSGNIFYLGGNSSDKSLNVNITSGGSGGTQYAEGATTAPATGTVALGRYNTSPPTLTNGQLNAPQLDVNGNLKVNIASGGGSGGTSSSFGSAFPSTGTAVGATDGTNMQALKVDGSNNLLTKVNVALPAGTNVIGHVITDTGSTTAVTGTVAVTQSTSPWIVAGGGTAGSAATGVVTIQGIASMTKLLVTPDSVALPANQSVNVSQINGVTPLMGNGVTGTGSQRVTIASDNTAFSVNATLSAETTKVIGTVNQGTSPWVVSGAVTSSPANSFISIVNSTTANLAGGATFTGTSEDISNYAAVQVSVFSSHASATDGLSLQQSSDGTNWDIADVYTIVATTGKVFSVQPAAKFYRLVYTNGATLTTSLRILSVYHYQAPNPSSQRSADAYTNETDLTQNWTFNSLYNGTGWDRMRGDITNGLDVDVTRLPALVAGAAVIGKVSIDQTTPGTTNLVALSAETTKVIGTVNQGTSPWVTSNATTSVVGNGAAATAQRVTLANDSTGIIATVGAVTAITNALPTGTNSIGKISDITTSITPGTGAANLGKAEDVAAASGDTGVATFGVRNDALTAAQTNATGDYGSFSIDTSGIQIVAGAPRALKARQVTTLTSSTAETTIITAIASTFNDVYGLILSNTSATATEVTVRDATAGGTISSFMVPAGDTRGFMLPLDSAVPQAAVNNNWTAQCGTSVASLKVTALYVKRV